MNGEIFRVALKSIYLQLVVFKKRKLHQYIIFMFLLPNVSTNVTFRICKKYFVETIED